MAINFFRINKGASLAAQSADPVTNVQDGDFYYNSTLNTFRFRQNATWISLSSLTGTFADNVFTIQDDIAPTKQFQFQASTITAGNTRVYNAPDLNGTLALLELAQTWTAIQTHSAAIVPNADNTINNGAPATAWSNVYSKALVVGTGDTSGTVTAGSIRAVAKTGANALGADLVIDSGNGTGTGGSGIIQFRTAPSAGSSSTANVFQSVGQVDKSGVWTIGVTAAAHLINGTISFNTTETTQAVNGFRRSATNTVALSTNSVDRLTVNSTTLASTLVFTGPAGAVGAPTYSFTADPDTGIYNSAANTLDFTTAGVNSGNISSSNIWTFGSTTTGDNIPHVFRTNGRTYIQINAATGNNCNLQFAENGVNSWQMKADASIGALSFINNAGASVGSISQTGAWTIGDQTGPNTHTLRSASTTIVDINTNASADVSLTFTDSTGNNWAINKNRAGTVGSQATSADSLDFNSGASGSVFRLGQTGQVLASNGSASAPTYSFSSTGNDNTGIYLAATDSLGFTANGVAVGSYSSAGAWTFGAAAGSGLTHVAQSNGSTIFRIKAASGSNADIELSNGATQEWVIFNNAGNTNSFDLNSNTATGILSINQSGSAPVFTAGSGAMTFKIQSASGNNTDLFFNNGTTNEWIFFNSAGGSAPDNDRMIFLSTAGNNVFILRQNAQVGVTTTNWGTGGTAIGVNGGFLSTSPSSLRYKKNIVELNTEIDSSLVYNLHPVIFDYKIDNRHSFGYIAEEVSDVLPCLVNYETHDGVSVPESVSYDHLAVLIVEELKKLKAEFDDYKASHP